MLEVKGRFHNTIYEFGIPAIQSACVCVCVYACVQTHVSMHAGACVITHMHKDSCIDVHYGKHTNIRTIYNTKICKISGFHIVEVENSGHLGCYTVWQF